MSMPNVRKMFVPDEGMMMGDLDLDSADLRIVVQESNCQGMKDLFREGLKPYLVIAREYFHDPSINKASPHYYTFKKLCHATNYLGKAPTIAGQCGLLVKEVERIQRWYFGMFPEIQKWQEDFVKKCIRTATVSNAFGYRKKWFDRIEGNTLNEMVAWLPQSSIAVLINKIYVNVDSNLPRVEVLLQVHDSLTLQYPIENKELHELSIREQCKVPIPYDDPLLIPIGIKTSTKSWGDCQ